MNLRTAALTLASVALALAQACSSSNSSTSAGTETAAIPTGDPAEAADLPASKGGPSVGLEGQPLEPVELSEEQWRERLSAQAFDVLREEGTERAFTSPLNQEKAKGVFLCAGCQAPVFASDTKFESGTGWPSFYEPFAPQNVAEVTDNSYGMRRVEVECNRCGGHLGHVFEDGPEPTGLRYCINGAALEFAAAP